MPIPDLSNLGWVDDPGEVARTLAAMPRPFFVTAATNLRGDGRGKTTLLYKAWKDATGSYLNYPAQTIGDCFVAGTMVLGEKTKPIERVEIGDRVWTAEGEMTTVVSRRAIETANPLIEVRPVGGLPITCTADHQFLVYRLDRVAGKRVTPNRHRRSIGSSSRNAQAAAVVSCYESREPTWVRAGDLRDTDCLLTPVGLIDAVEGQWADADKSRQYTWRDQDFFCRPVRSTRFVEGPATVYDIGVASDHHSFIADGAAVHNCVSQGYAHGVDLLACVEIAIGNEPESFVETATEPIYGVSRVDVGGGRLRGDGSVGAWAAKAVTDFGTASRESVGAYSGQRAREWGSRGVPSEIKSKLTEHKVRTTSLVTTYEELEDALANGYPVVVCSNQGFSMTRDANGFCRAQGSWSHCMLICAVRADERPGACIFQSWGANVPSGSLSLDQPNNSFWADRQTVSRMLSARDSFALSSFDGYPGRPLPSNWTYADLSGF